MPDKIAHLVLISLGPVIGLIGNTAVFCVCMRLHIRMLAGLLAGFILGFGMLAVIFVITPVSVSHDFVITSSALYILLGYCFFHFNNLAVTARRIRILREIYLKKNMTMPELQKSYNAEGMLVMRINRLRKSAQIAESNGRLFIRPGILIYATMILIGLKKLFYGRPFADAYLGKNNADAAGKEKNEHAAYNNC